MISRNIVFTKENKAEIISENVRDLKSDEILVKLCVSSISSGTERALLTGNRTVSISNEYEERARFPRRSGYSSSGVVEKVGENVTSVKVGDRVALTWSLHKEYVIAKESNVYNINGISFENAAMFHIGIFPLAAIRKCKVEMGESVVVMGMGVLGIVALQLLRSAGATPIIAVDPNPAKRDKALSCGADFAFDPYDVDFEDKVKEVTNGGADVGIEVTGVGAGLNGILDCMARFGRVALLGCTRDSNFSIDYYHKVHGPGISLIGAHTNARPISESYNGCWTENDDMMTLIRLTETGRINLEDVVDERYSPIKATEVYHKLAVDKVFPVVQFDWRNL